MVDLFNINYTILFAIDTLSPHPAHQTTHNAKINSRKESGNEGSPNDVRCIKGKGDDSPSLRDGFFVFWANLE